MVQSTPADCLARLTVGVGRLALVAAQRRLRFNWPPPHYGCVFAVWRVFVGTNLSVKIGDDFGRHRL